MKNFPSNSAYAAYGKHQRKVFYEIHIGRSDILSVLNSGLDGSLYELTDAHDEFQKKTFHMHYYRIAIGSDI